MQRVGEQGRNPVNVENSVLAPFFANLPNQFFRFVDGRDIGPSSYTYEITGSMGKMYSQCAQSNQNANTRRLHEGCTPLDELDPKVVPIDSTSIKLHQWYSDLYNASLNAMAYEDYDKRDILAAQELEKINCMFYKECRGEVIDYTPEFLTHWKATNHTMCSQFFMNIEAGNDKLRVGNWRELTTVYFSCDGSN